MTAKPSRSTSKLRASANAFAVAFLAGTGCSAWAQGGTTVALQDAVAMLDALAMAEAQARPGQILVLDVVINGVARGQAYAFVNRDGVLFLDADEVVAWRIAVARLPIEENSGRRFAKMAPELGIATVIDWKWQRADLTVPAQYFIDQSVTLPTGGTSAIQPPPLAGFFNYSLFGYKGGGTSTLSALTELGISGPHGVFLNTSGVNTATAFGGTTNEWVRWETSWRIDNPANLTTLIVGDSTTAPGPWGRSLRFGGIQFGSNFQLQPSLVTYPLQAVSGAAVVPSTVDIFVNGSRISSQPVQPGPFSINNVPVPTGDGQVQVVVRDAFGQQQIISQPFYASRTLLRAGLTEYQLSFGAVRENFGLDSGDYGGGLGSAVWRYGLTDRITANARADATSNVRAAGAGVDWTGSLPGTFSLGAAGSQSNFGTGYSGLAGYEYNSPTMAFSARGTWASEDFMLAGDTALPGLQRQTAAAASYSFGRYGAVGVAWAEQRYRRTPSTQVGSLSYSVSLGPYGFIGATLFRTLSTVNQTTATLSWNLPLGNSTSFSMDGYSTKYGDNSSGYAGWTLQKSLPTDEGFGYRVRATTDQRAEAGVGYASPFGVLTAEAATSSGTSATRANFSGGIGYIEGRTFASRAIVDSFALVRVGDFEGISVAREGNPVGTTGPDGTLIVPRMSPYSASRITIDEKELPIDVALRSNELRATPYYRSGVLVDFEAVRLRAAFVSIVLPGGAQPSPGSVATDEASKATVPIGARGAMYLDNATAGARFRLELPDGHCTVTLPTPLPDFAYGAVIGPYECRRSAP
jgi:outer membrane usher protein